MARYVTVPVMLCLASACVEALSMAPQVDRRLERTFQASPDSVVTVRITGGPITVETGGAGSVHLVLDQRVEASSEAEADEILGAFEISATQQATEIVLLGRARRDNGSSVRRRNQRVQLSARLTVPPNVRLDLDTSGGPITVRGERTASVKADTSGGPITVDGGGELDLDTSGGGIRVGRALSVLHADTSGGGITVDYVGPAVSSVALQTSGGSIRVGVDRAAKLDVRAATSGGGVTIEGLALETRTLRRSSASGTINGGGGGRLTAHTSGGSIQIRSATP
jgi:hypothetical protein